jgi:hypothetical protein
MTTDATPEPEHHLYSGMTVEGQAAVGRIAIWAARVEENLVDMCASLINSNVEIGHAVTANMSASSMIQLAKKLASASETLSPEDKADFLAALTEAKAALEQRNKILHAATGEFIFDGKTTFTNTRRKKVPAAAGQLPQVEAASHSPEDLDEIGARLFRASEDLWACVFLPHE